MAGDFNNHVQYSHHNHLNHPYDFSVDDVALEVVVSNGTSGVPSTGFTVDSSVPRPMLCVDPVPPGDQMTLPRHSQMLSTTFNELLSSDGGDSAEQLSIQEQSGTTGYTLKYPEKVDEEKRKKNREAAKRVRDKKNQRQDNVRMAFQRESALQAKLKYDITLLKKSLEKWINIAESHKEVCPDFKYTLPGRPPLIRKIRAGASPGTGNTLMDGRTVKNLKSTSHATISSKPNYPQASIGSLNATSCATDTGVNPAQILSNGSFETQNSRKRCGAAMYEGNHDSRTKQKLQRMINEQKILKSNIDTRDNSQGCFQNQAVFTNHDNKDVSVSTAEESCLNAVGTLIPSAPITITFGPLQPNVPTIIPQATITTCSASVSDTTATNIVTEIENPLQILLDKIFKNPNIERSISNNVSSTANVTSQLPRPTSQPLGILTTTNESDINNKCTLSIAPSDPKLTIPNWEALSEAQDIPVQESGGIGVQPASTLQLHSKIQSCQENYQFDQNCYPSNGNQNDFKVNSVNQQIYQHQNPADYDTNKVLHGFQQHRTTQPHQPQNPGEYLVENQQQRSAEVDLIKAALMESSTHTSSDFKNLSIYPAYQNQMVASLSQNNHVPNSTESVYVSTAQEPDALSTEVVLINDICRHDIAGGLFHATDDAIEQNVEGSPEITSENIGELIANGMLTASSF